MAVHTKHRVSAPPAAPLREKTGHLLLRAWCVFVPFLAFSGTAWTLAFGETTTIAVTIGSGLVSGVLWAVLRPAVSWRALPWFILGYVALAIASIAWSAWPATSALTVLLLVVTTVHALFLGAVLSWREIVRALSTAAKWTLGLSLLFELVVSVFVGGPVLPGFVIPAQKADDPIEYWSRDNLFAGDRIQGIMGNSNLLAGVALIALIVFALRFAARAERRVVLGGWLVLAAFLFVRAGSATVYLAAAAVAVVAGTILLMRTTTRPGQRTRYYVLYGAIGLTATAVLWFGRDAVAGLLGRGGDLTGREGIWAEVLTRAAERPIAGGGFATPWLPWDAAFDGWITDHGQTVMQAHNMWLDVFLQLGVLGLVLLVGAYIAFVWRAWFFAIDRPRWDLRADRPYSPLTMLPSLVATVPLVQGLTESGPLLLWGWMLFVLFSAKITQAPLLGVGPAEQSLSIERGDLQKRDA